MPTAVGLIDPVPGNIGLVADADTVILLPFDESDGVRITDAAGTLEDMQGAPTVSSTGAWASAATRSFGAAANVLSAQDRAGESSLLTRDVTVQAILASQSSLYTGILISRGDGTGATQYTSFAVELDCAATNNMNVRWSWQDTAGLAFTDTWRTFAFPPGEAFLLTLTRRWVSSTSVVMRYYVDDQLVAESTSTTGEIGGATTGTTTVGGDTSGAQCPAIWLDALKVTSHEMSHEEIRATWKRLTQHQPNGVIGLRGQAPPGAPWSQAAGSDIGSLIKAAGQAVGYAAAKTDELRETFLPSSAYRDTIARWERLVGLQVNTRVALGTRRQRVLARLQRENGYSPPKVREVLAAPFDLAEYDVELVEFSPTIEDGFATVEAERWRTEPPAAWAAGAGGDLGTLKLDVASADMRFEAAGHNPYHCRMSVDNDEDLIVQVKLRTYWAALPSSAIVGLFLYNRVTNDALWFGVKNDGGTRKLGYVLRKNNVLGTFQTITNPSTDVAYYLRLTRLTSGEFQFAWSTTSFASVTTIIVSGLIENVQWAGVGAMATTNPTGSALTATFDDFLARITAGRRAFHWYAFRDTGLAGEPDMNFANRLLPTLKPAHTHAAAITSRSLLCDNAGSGCDRGPMGGI